MTIKEISVSNEELRVMLESGYILREAAKFEQAEAIFRGVMEFLPESEVPQVGTRHGFSPKRRFSGGRGNLRKGFGIKPRKFVRPRALCRSIAFRSPARKGRRRIARYYQRQPEFAAQPDGTGTARRG
jgi:hypothetical protein